MGLLIEGSLRDWANLKFKRVFFKSGCRKLKAKSVDNLELSVDNLELSVDNL